MHGRALILTFIIMALVIPQLTIAQKSIKTVQGNSGKRYALCIGINDYLDKRIIDLKNSRGDAEALGKILEAEGQFDEVIVMTDYLGTNSPNYPKRTNVLEKFKSLKALIKPEDLVLFFFSGHGVSNSTGDGFLVLATSYREKLNATSLKIKELTNWLKEMGVKKSILLLDGRREQFLQGGTAIKGIAMESFTSADVGAVFYATRSGGFGCDDTGGSLGLFAAVLADGLKGHADTSGDNLVSFAELEAYIAKAIPQWAAANGKNQTPATRILAGGGLVLSAYSTKPASIVQGFKATAPVVVNAVQLRSSPLTLKEADVKSIIQKNGFFDKKRNPSRNFKNGFQAKSIGGVNVVLDAATGLMWHAGGSSKGLEFEQARQWIQALNQQKYAGFGDWRMPTLEEAASLMESSRLNGSLHIAPAFSGSVTNIWTSDKAGGEGGWIADFSMGRINRDYYFNFFFARPVRSNK